LHPQRIPSDSAEFVHQHGYAVFPNILCAVQIFTLTCELSQAQWKRSRAGARHILSVPVMRNLAEDSRLLEIARAVLGPTAIPFRTTLFDKSPSSSWLVAWHQDTALPP